MSDLDINTVAQDAAERIADALWNRMGTEIKSRVKLRLIDNFLRHVIALSDYDVDQWLTADLIRRTKELMLTPEVVAMLKHAAKQRVTRRVTIKLETHGIKVSSLTPEERAWLEKRGYEVATKEKTP